MKDRGCTDFTVTYDGVDIYIEIKSTDYEERINQYLHWLKWTRHHVYEIMHGTEKVACIAKNGICRIYEPELMPYNLYLEQGPEEDIDIRVQNLENFYYWCASRVLTLDREYAKEILNSIGVAQATTDKERAEVALSYHCLSLMDIYWTKRVDEPLEFSKINLYENHFGNAFIDVSLRGRQMTIENAHLMADSLGTKGCFPKAWIRDENHFFLLKDGGTEAVNNELLASRICRCFKVNQVLYEEGVFDQQKVSCSKIITSPEYGIVPMEYLTIYLQNQGLNAKAYVLQLDAYNYYMMNIVDYLVGNTDRHWGNWGVLVDNTTNRPVRLYDLMDFNKAFGSFDTIEGANCLTSKFLEGKMQTQKEAALEAVEKIGLNQVEEVSGEWFEDKNIREMFFERLKVLKGVQ